MKKRFTDTDAFKWLRTLGEIALIVLFVLAIIWACQKMGISEGAERTMYAICRPGDRVNIRATPSTKGATEGWLEPGDEAQTDGQEKNGYLHCVGLSNESGDGWVHAGYLVEDAPVLVNQKAVVVSNGRLAARKCVDGEVNRWLKWMTEVRVSYRTDVWCVTNAGYVKTEFLEMVGE